MRVKILSKIWKLVWVPKGESVAARKAKGLRDYDPTSMSKSDLGLTEAPDLKKKRMFIRAGLPEKEELEVVLHECLHAADWTKDEEWIDDTAVDLARVLWSMGWRKTKDGA